MEMASVQLTPIADQPMESGIGSSTKYEDGVGLDLKRGTQYRFCYSKADSLHLRSR